MFKPGCISFFWIQVHLTPSAGLICGCYRRYPLAPAIFVIDDLLNQLKTSPSKCILCKIGGSLMTVYMPM